jgi:thymidylate synthase
MKEYKELASKVLEQGVIRPDRTGTGALSLFGAQSRIDLRTGFPVLTTKRVRWRNAIKETLWFLRGESNVSSLGCGIWDAWADDRGELGPIYGVSWRKWTGTSCNNEVIRQTDQIRSVIHDLKTNPWGRRHVVSAWNVSQLDEMSLPPCHLLFQLYVSPDEMDRPHWLDLSWYQRSADICLGVPFNWIGYGVICQLIARECGLIPRFLIHTIGDAHIYTNHLDGIRRQLTRDEQGLPTLVLPEYDLDIILAGDHSMSDDFQLIGYNPHSRIRFPIAV